MNPLADAALRASIVLLIGLALRAGLRRRSPALRHAVLAAAIVAAPVAGLIGAVAPGVAVPTGLAGARPTAIVARGSSCGGDGRDRDVRDGCARRAPRDPLRRSDRRRELDGPGPRALDRRRRRLARLAARRGRAPSRPGREGGGGGGRPLAPRARCRLPRRRAPPAGAPPRLPGCHAARDVGLAPAAGGDPRVRAGLERRARAHRAGARDRARRAPRLAPPVGRRDAARAALVEPARLARLPRAARRQRARLRRRRAPRPASAPTAYADELLQIARIVGARPDRRRAS